MEVNFKFPRADLESAYPNCVKCHVCVSDVHLNVMYNHDNWDFICYFGGHFVLQFWKKKN